MSPLNGWRRLGLVVAVLWFCGVIASVIFNLTSESSGPFVRHGIPKGMLVEGDKVTLPNGKVVKIDNRDPVTGRELAPWEIKWDAQPSEIRVTEVRWSLLGIALAMVPVVWLLIELGVVVSKWVARGFQRQKTP